MIPEPRHGEKASQWGVVIASVAPGDFTTTGHFIVLASMNADGTLAVHDPNSEERSMRNWDVQRVLDQCRALWALTS